MGDTALDKVNTGSALSSIPIKGGVWFHEVGDVRNVNTDIISSILI